MSITEGTQPAPLQWTGAWTTAQTTAAFVPEAGALLLAIVSGDGAISASPNVTVSITDSLGGTWTPLLVQENASTTTTGGYVGVWCRDSPGASLTVSVTASGDARTGGQLCVRTLIGAANKAGQNGATNHAVLTSTAVQTSVAAGTGNKIYGAALDYDVATAMTVLANTSNVSNFADSTNGDNWAAFKSSGDTAGTATYGYSTTAHAMIAAVEIIAGAAGSNSGPNTPSTATDLGGWDNTWVNPTNAQGGDDGTVAVWTVP